MSLHQDKKLCLCPYYKNDGLWKNKFSDWEEKCLSGEGVCKDFNVTINTHQGTQIGPKQTIIFGKDLKLNELAFKKTNTTTVIYSRTHYNGYTLNGEK